MRQEAIIRVYIYYSNESDHVNQNAYACFSFDHQKAFDIVKDCLKY